MVAFTLSPAVTLSGSPTYVPGTSAAGDGDTATYIEFIPASLGVLGQSAAISFNLSSDNYSSITFTAIVSRPTSSPARFTWDIVDANGTTGGNGSTVDVGSTDDITAAAGVLQTITRTFDNPYFAPGGQGETEDFVNPPGTTLLGWLDGLIAVAPSPRLVMGSSLGTVRVHEITLTGVSTAALYPLRRYPPINNGGSGPTRHYPRAVNRRAGGTY